MAAARTRFSYRALQAWARSAVRVVYRRVDVTGLEHVPVDRPAILAANHGNALADIAVIVAKMPRFPQFLAAGSWWKSAPARVLFRLGGVVPIHRGRDAVDTRHNLATFEACHAALAGGAHIAIFPEGEMHTEPALLPLKTGAARIALGAATEAGVTGVALVPVGLVYEDRGRFRSDVEIRFGEAVEIDEWTGRAAEQPGKAAREITDVLADRLAEVTVNHGSHTEAALLDRAAALVVADETDPGRRTFAHRNELRRALAAAVSATGGEAAPAYLGLADALEVHEHDLERLGFAARGAAPALAEPAPGERTAVGRELARLAAPAALGLAVNAPVLAGAALAGGRARQESWRATLLGVSGTFLCPVVWGAEYALAARRIGRGRAFALVGAGAAGGLVTLAWQERYERRRAIRRLDLLARDRPADLAAARASRAAVRRAVDALTGQR